MYYIFKTSPFPLCTCVYVHLSFNDWLHTCIDVDRKITPVVHTLTYIYPISMNFFICTGGLILHLTYFLAQYPPLLMPLSQG